MFEAAAFCASRITLSIAGLFVTMSLKVTAPPFFCARLASASSASTLSALASAVRSLSGEAGLTTKSKAPLRIADTTVSMPPCAVWTTTGMPMPRFAHRLQHADAVEAGHGEVEHDRGDVAARGRFQRLKRRFATLGEQRFVAEFRDGSLQQAALHRIVIDYEDGTCHEGPLFGACLGSPLPANWINLAQGSKQRFKKAGERSL